MHQCVCKEQVNGGWIVGKCLATKKCEGMSFQSDVESGGMDKGGLDALKGIVDQLMSAMKGGGGGGGGAGEVPTDPNAIGCTTYYPTTVPSSDPCAIYSPSGVLDAAASGNAGVSSSLLDALNGSSNTGSTNTGTKTTPTPTKTGATGETKTGTNVTAAAPGLSGDVRIGSAGATIIANLRQGLSEVAGFFGGSTGGASQALSAAGKLCSTRPWAGSFVGNVIPSSFFDGLCEWRGYQAGIVTPTNTAKASNAATQKTSTSRPGISLQPTVSDVPPEVDIWAEPSSVRLGTRTYIFWNARGVVSCKGSGPSFSQNSLSGGASTVPITGPTTFNIECLTTASSTVKDSVTVQIAI